MCMRRRVCVFGINEEIFLAWLIIKSECLDVGARSIRAHIACDS